MGTTEDIQVDKKDTQKLKDNKDEVVDSVASETGMDSREERQMIRQSVEHVYLDEEYEHIDFEETERLSPTFKKSLFSGPRPSHGVAEIADLREEKGVLQVKFEVRNSDKKFTRSYKVKDPDDKDRSSLNNITNVFGNIRSSGHKREEFEKLVRITDAKINKPTSLIGEEVPIIPESFDTGYNIHYPPEQPSVLMKTKYRFIRSLFYYQFVGYNDEKRDIEFSYFPTTRAWLFAFGMLAVSLIVPISMVAKSLFMISALVIIIGLLVTTMIYMLD